ncbi:MAG TPA: PLP-dependent transferase [Acidimicrobiales bacterium]|nr:PLP-dependent transferase [Acidimicrobiales bacterium]
MEPLDPSTIAVSLGRGAHRAGDPLNVPVVLSSTFRAGGAIGYAREGNPVWEAFEEVIGALEGGVAVVFPSGLAAVRAILELVPVGGHVVAAHGSYSGTRRLLQDLEARGRLTTRLVDITDTSTAVGAADGAALLWAESPTNPMMGVADLAGLRAAKPELYVVDNTFATPLLQRPLVDAGADLVVHSATKLIGGHSDVVLGVVVARDESLASEIRQVRTEHGAVAGPLEVFLALRGVRTLPVRVERASATAAALAGRFGSHAGVDEVLYPGFGTMLSVLVHGGAAAAERFCSGVRLAVPATSLGGVETLVERRAQYHWDAVAGVPDNLVRISVGLEHVDDVWRDFEQALAQIT